MFWKGGVYHVKFGKLYFQIYFYEESARVASHKSLEVKYSFVLTRSRCLLTLNVLNSILNIWLNYIDFHDNEK